MDRKLYAQFASLVYEKEPPQEVSGFKLLEGGDRTNLWTNDTTVVMAVRGTNPTNRNDLGADLTIFFNQLHRTNVYKKLNKKVKQVHAAHPSKKLIVTGHSLGGTLCLTLLKDNLKIIDACYAYNPGVSPAAIRKHFLSVCFTKKCKRERAMFKAKAKIYTTGADLISGLSILQGARVVRPNQGINTHGVANFTEPAKMTTRPLHSPPQVSEVEPLPVTTLPLRDPPSDQTGGGFKPVRVVPKGGFKKPHVGPKPVQVVPKGGFKKPLLGGSIHQGGNSDIGYWTQPYDIGNIPKEQFMKRLVGGGALDHQQFGSYRNTHRFHTESIPPDLVHRTAVV